MTTEMTSSAMSEEATTALVPKLRFPDFHGAEEWGSAILGDLSQVVRGASPRPIDAFLTTAADGLNWLKIGDVDKEAKYVTHTAEKVRSEALNKTRVVNPGDLILSNSMSFGRPYILQIKTCIHDGWIAITDIAKKADRDFLYYLISAPSSQIYFIDDAAGSGVQNLNADIIKALPVFFPLPAEQERIADCLTLLDELIATQSQKVDALRTHKKGLMQQLFPREGETQPRLRFPEFQNAGEWGMKPFGDLLDDIIDFRGRTPVKLGMQWGGGKITSLSANNVKNGFIDYAAECNLGSEELYQRWMGDVNLEKDDIVFTMEAPLGKALLLPDSEKYILSQRVVAFKTKPTVRNPFLIQLIWSEGFQKAIDQLATGSTAKGINQKALKTVLVQLPEAPEQERIATCLSSLDALITAETQKLDALKIHKKGLMQQLFPSPQEPRA